MNTSVHSYKILISYLEIQPCNKVSQRSIYPFHITWKYLFTRTGMFSTLGTHGDEPMLVP